MSIIRGGGRNEHPRLINRVIRSGRSTLRFVGDKVVDRDGREVKLRPLRTYALPRSERVSWTARVAAWILRRVTGPVRK